MLRVLSKIKKINPFLERFDVWQSSADRLYDIQKNNVIDLQNIMKSDKNGNYPFKTLVPKFYPVPTDGPVVKYLRLGRLHLDLHIFIL